MSSVVAAKSHALLEYIIRPPKGSLSISGKSLQVSYFLELRADIALSTGLVQRVPGASLRVHPCTRCCAKITGLLFGCCCLESHFRQCCWPTLRGRSRRRSHSLLPSSHPTLPRSQSKRLCHIATMKISLAGRCCCSVLSIPRRGFPTRQRRCCAPCAAAAAICFGAGEAATLRRIAICRRVCHSAPGPPSSSGIETNYQHNCMAKPQPDL